MSIRPSLVIYAKDTGRLAQFYESVLGLTQETDDGYLTLRGPEYSIVVVRIPSQLASHIEISSPPLRREDVAIKFVAPVDSIARARDAAPPHGGAVDPPDREFTFQGMIRCDCVDCEGNILQLATPANAS